MKALYVAAAALLALALYLDRPAPPAAAAAPAVWPWFCSARPLQCADLPPTPVALLRDERAESLSTLARSSALLEREREILARRAEPILAVVADRGTGRGGGVGTLFGGPRVRGTLNRGDPPAGLGRLVVSTAQVWCLADDAPCLRRLAHHWCAVEMPSSYRCGPGYDLAARLTEGLGSDGCMYTGGRCP